MLWKEEETIIPFQSLQSMKFDQSLLIPRTHYFRDSSPIIFSLAVGKFSEFFCDTLPITG